MEIIDFHLHPEYDFHLQTHGVAIDLDRFERDLRACDITKCCGSVIDSAVQNLPISEYETLIPKLNDRALAVKERLGDFYVPGIHIHPAFPEMSCREIERCHQKGVRLIGELVPYMMGWKNCATPAFLEIMACARDHDMVVNIHPTNAADMYALSEAVPQVKLVWAHFSGYGHLAHHMDMLRRYPNVYFDLSAHGTDVVGVLRKAIDEIGCDRFLFGTDYPGVGPATDIAAIRFERLTDEEMEMIFSKNAKRLLCLES